MRQYRLIYNTPTDGKRNMAVDEAIMTAVADGESLPTLRLYAWNPPCLSLGYGQTWKDVDMARVQAAGWDVVRRATGGRAILHTDELTYSIALPADHPLAEGSIVESYRRISQALMAALARVGMQPHADRRTTPLTSAGPVCFEIPSHYEITTGDGRKLVGSAQVRRKGGVLQHGSLPLCGDVARICDALVYADENERERAKAQVRQRAATLADTLGGTVIPWEQMAQAVAAGFSETFDIEFVECGLSTGEKLHVEQLVYDVYGAAAWTERL